MEIKAFDKDNWQGRIDIEDGELGLRIHQIIKPFENQSNSKVFLGFCSEEGVKRNKGRLGAKKSPDIIRKALSNLPIHFSTQDLYDSGNIIVDEDLEEAREIQVDKISVILNQHSLPIVIGGGHETALGSFLAFAKKYPKNSIIINLDAHFDIRLPKPVSTSGTPFYEMFQYCEQNQIDFNYFVLGIQQLGNTQALFKRADDLKITYKLADEIHADLNNVLEDLKTTLNQYDNIYLSIDMDVFDAAFAPGVSATTINGLTPFQIKSIIQVLKLSNKIKLVDVVEVNPNYDIDNQTAKLAAHIIYEFLKN